MSETWRAVAQEQFRMLFFRRMTGAFQRWPRHAWAWGLGVTWLAGVGRYWDHPSAAWFQYAGLGSLVYIAIMGGVIQFLVAPLAEHPFRYRYVVLFLSMTSLPAVLYAIPVERFMSEEAALVSNVVFLAVVAAWRVLLYLTFLRRYAGLTGLRLALGAVTPVCFVVVVLSTLNLEQAIFDVMAGIRHDPEPGRVGRYGFTMLLAVTSFFASPVLAILYAGVMIQRAWQLWKAHQRADTSDGQDSSDGDESSNEGDSPGA